MRNVELNLFRLIDAERSKRIRELLVTLDGIDKWLISLDPDRTICINETYNVLHDEVFARDSKYLEILARELPSLMLNSIENSLAACTDGEKKQQLLNELDRIRKLSKNGNYNIELIYNLLINTALSCSIFDTKFALYFREIYEPLIRAFKKSTALITSETILKASDRSTIEYKAMKNDAYSSIWYMLLVVFSQVMIARTPEDIADALIEFLKYCIHACYPDILDTALEFLR